ncbi:MAG TPA: cupredoxin family copper-binding protein [Candidatus Limnocylindria bacterium]|nr:cupredoxin family copper-binding protein [Candidatus Limnocylindria bacterium]
MTALVLGASAGIATPTAQAATEHRIDISGFAFNPSTLTIQVGDTVTWTNADDAPHTATADGGAFDSGNLDTGASFSHTFTQAGTFSYECEYHSEMEATIVVVPAASQAPAAAATSPSAAAAATAAATAGQPDTAVPAPPPGGMRPAIVVMGLGLLLMGLAIVPLGPRPGAVVRSGWRR